MFKFLEDEFVFYSNDYAGICLSCGEIADSVEPDAEGYKCESCGEEKVCGFEQALIMGEIDIC